MNAASDISQGWLFQKLRWRLFRNSTSTLFRASRVRIATIIVCSLLIWIGLYAASYEGFSLLNRGRVPFAGGIIGLLFDALFFTLGGMLVFSTGLILYASLFTGAEAKFLLTTPARADQIFASKFQSAVAFSSWAFIVLGGPILIGYGVFYEVPWFYYLLLPVWLLGYVILAGSLGGMIGLLIVNFFPQRRRHALIAMITLLAAAGLYWLVRIIILSRASFSNHDALEEVFGMFNLARSPYSPSRWVSRGLLSIARNDFAGSLLPMCLLWSNALFIYLVAAVAAKTLYRRGFNRMSGGGSSRRIYGSHWLDEVMRFLVGYLDPKTRLLIVKDFRTFRREPVQVGQLGLFAGLMLMCVFNIRQFFGADLPAVNQSVVSMLNLVSTGLLMCAYLGRFVYPLISLEGRKFWILGLLPLKREQLLWGKFAFAVTMSSLLAGSIVFLSDLVLDLPWTGIFLHQFALLVLSVGLSGLCVGMSAALPNFRETDPSKIVVGFGGTLFTVASLVFLLVTLVAMCIPYHLMMARDSFLKGQADFPAWGYLGVSAGVALGALAIWLPMRIGVRTLRTMEF